VPPQSLLRSCTTSVRSDQYSEDRNPVFVPTRKYPKNPT
jgi:hypothetical protein